MILRYNKTKRNATMTNCKDPQQSRQRFNEQAMTLPELLIAAGILALAITGILLSYMRCMELNEISQNTSVAIKAATSRLEQIRNTTFSTIQATYDQVAFDVNGLEGKGVAYIDNSNPDLLKVDVCVSWRQNNGRVHGQDLNLNGQIDGGEDPDGNNILDAPVQLTTYIFDK